MLEPENDFERAIVETCREIGEMLIRKNRLYGDSFRNIRQLSLMKLESSRIPLWLHIIEKLDRYMKNQPDDTEDIERDAAGYFILEAVCRRFDDHKQEKL